jgi:group I intron endonuclease
MKNSGIYGICNIANGKWYVGQSTDLKYRERKHFWLLKRKGHYNAHLQHAFSKYGTDNFEFRVLEEVSENMLDVRECAWIEFYKSNQEQFGYNLRTGGHLNHHPSEATKKKLSNLLAGRRKPPFSEKHKTNMSKAQVGNNRQLLKWYEKNKDTIDEWNHYKSLM